MINSILDTDTYKITMQQAVLELYPDAVAQYRFVNRRPEDTFTESFVDKLRGLVASFANLSLTPEEMLWLRPTCPFLKPSYLEYLYNYRFNPEEVSIRLVDGQLELGINGPWHRTILWEVPLMATISELYFSSWGPKEAQQWNYNEQSEKAKAKARVLGEAGCIVADFGTRRRRSRWAQNLVVKAMAGMPGFVGTSNVELAFDHGVKPIGTMAHEWFQGHSVTHGLRHANRYALEAWVQVYRSELGIALTDTYGSKAFFGDFDAYLARLYDGVRHDSGCPFQFAEDVVAHYKDLRIPPENKTIIFSDSLNTEKAVRIQGHCNNLGIKAAYGIGTHLTNDFDTAQQPLNIVIKLVGLNDLPVVKLSDDAGKAIGDPDALRVARWTFFGTPLDSNGVLNTVIHDDSLYGRWMNGGRFPT